jgi:hypothetical protein
MWAAVADGVERGCVVESSVARKERSAGGKDVWRGCAEVGG